MKDLIVRIQKEINHNGCWIPKLKPNSKGYTLWQKNKKRYVLSRLVVSVKYNLNYNDQFWEARHSEGCDRRCFNFDHLIYGSHADNIRDTVLHGTHINSKKLVCPKCNGPYKHVGVSKRRRCTNCFNTQRRLHRANSKNA